MTKELLKDNIYLHVRAAVVAARLSVVADWAVRDKRLAEGPARRNLDEEVLGVLTRTPDSFSVPSCNSSIQGETE